MSTPQLGIGHPCGASLFGGANSSAARSAPWPPEMVRRQAAPTRSGRKRYHIVARPLGDPERRVHHSPSDRVDAHVVSNPTGQGQSTACATGTRSNPRRIADRSPASDTRPRTSRPTRRQRSSRRASSAASASVAGWEASSLWSAASNSAIFVRRVLDKRRRVAH